ncbi:quinone oxidoreductase family protein [Streptomyces muensis]|uniref:Zinc-binding dehydrogenase n=1 Tax=Streptomyces muensis TaxID=1077944 RepID=A0A9X1TK86_STRM4|nr:zinc-binding dehydrogenase [Streptomyces muensis]MCF1595376.1 zinc-binding dehydrogenase [Streptomyces muensis]
MRAVQFDRYGAPDVLHVAERPVPEPGPGQVRIAVEAVSVGHAQTQMRREVFPAPMWKPVFPVVLGGDVVGRISAVGPEVTGLSPGDRVGAFTLYGAYAEQVVVDAATVVAVPEELDAAEAAVLPGTGLIALGVLRAGQLAKGETVLVHAAAGGVGHIAVQLARAAGAGQVIGTAGESGKREFARAVGADAVVDHRSPTWAEEVRELTGGRGPDLILDGVGAEVLQQGVRLLAPGGRLVFYGSSGGELEIPRVSVMDLIGIKYVTGFALSAWRLGRPQEYEAGVAELTRLLADGQVKSAVHARLPLERAAEAHTLLEARAQLGRVVLIP